MFCVKEDLPPFALKVQYNPHIIMVTSTRTYVLRVNFITRIYYALARILRVDSWMKRLTISRILWHSLGCGFVTVAASWVSLWAFILASLPLFHSVNFGDKWRISSDTQGKSWTDVHLRLKDNPPSLTSHSCSWYHSIINRHTAEGLLMANGKDGSYLLRASTSNPGEFSLSVRYVGCVRYQVSLWTFRPSLLLELIHSSWKLSLCYPR